MSSACPAAPNSAAKASAKLAISRIANLPGFGPFGPSLISNAEIVVQLLHIVGQLRVREVVHDTPMFHHVIAVGNGRGEAEILLDQQDGKTLSLEGADGVADLLNNDRGQAFGRLVEQQEPRAGAQYAGDRQHLLLAAGQFRALAFQPFAQIREQRKDAIEIETAGPHLWRQQQILLDVETGKDAPLLGAEGDAGTGDHVGGKLGQLAVLKAHRTGAVFDDAHDRLERRGFANAVAAEQRYHLAGLHVEGRAVKHVGLAVPGFEIVDGKERARLSHDWSQDAWSQDDWSQDDRSRDRLRAPPDPPTPSCNRPRPARCRG